MTNLSENTLIDIRDAAELTGYSVKHLNKLIKSKEIRAKRIDGTYMIEWQDVKHLAFSQKPFWVI